jgi:hypothetical protein
MGKRKSQYTLAELVSAHEADQPGLLTHIPSVETYTFSKDMDDLIRLHVGTVCGFVPVCATITGQTKPKLLYESGKVFKNYYDPAKEEQWSKITLSEPFSFVESGGDGWEEKLKALISFLFLQGGYTKHFIDLNGGKGVDMLFAALKTIPDPKAKHKVSVELKNCSEYEAAEHRVSVDEMLAANHSANDSSMDVTSSDGDLAGDTSAPSTQVRDTFTMEVSVKVSVRKTTVKKTPTEKTRAKRSLVKKSSPNTASPLKMTNDLQPQDKQLNTPKADYARNNSESDTRMLNIKVIKKRTHVELLEDETEESEFISPTLHLNPYADLFITSARIQGSEILIVGNCEEDFSHRCFMLINICHYTIHG